MTIELRMSPSPGSSFARYVGDRFEVVLEAPPSGCAFLRTNLGRAQVARAEVVARAGLREQESVTFAGASWRDIALIPFDGGFRIDVPLLEVGHFRAKAYWVDEAGVAHWPSGDDVSLSVHPNHIRTANVIYCAFVRTFGPNRTARVTIDPSLDERVTSLEERGYSVIPKSGTLRDLAAFVPHIFDSLGCRILHLLPIGPTPTTYARMGRFGSPYAQLDLTAIDPALIEHDRRTTAVDQFRELTDAVHRRSGLVFLDVVLNHTGWGSRLLDERPTWFVRGSDGCFVSPGAWGVVWGDLVELDHRRPELWEAMASALLTWCRRGVDGFRCDAAYMVPLAAWQYVVARVRSEFPNTVFLVEGLGGPWDATSALLCDGGMQWAYSELFQNHRPDAVSGYLDHAIRAANERGVLVHYAETHDNDRLASRGTAHALHRCRLVALSSQSGAFGFTAGVEWLAKEKIDVHEARGLAWGSEPNLVPALTRLDALLANHPCFFDGAALVRESASDSPVFALSRTSADGLDHLLVLANLEEARASDVTLPIELFRRGGDKTVDLLGEAMPRVTIVGESVNITLRPGQVTCLASHATPIGLAGDAYRSARAQAAFAYECLAHRLPHEHMAATDFRALAALVARDPAAFVGAMPYVERDIARVDLVEAVRAALAAERLPAVVSFSPSDAPKDLMLPPDHALVVRDREPFHVRYEADGRAPYAAASVPVPGGHVVALPPTDGAFERIGRLDVRRHHLNGTTVTTSVLELAKTRAVDLANRHGVGMLTNGRGAMVRMQSNLGAIESKYDALLAANLHPSVPSERHVFVKRVRAWANAHGFLTPLSDENRESFTVGDSLAWIFAANAGDGHVVEIHLSVEMRAESNVVRIVLERPRQGPRRGSDVPKGTDVRMTLRFDVEDRSFHAETLANDSAREHFARNTRTLDDRPGFELAPTPERQLVVVADAGLYHPAIEWTHVDHPLERSRGMMASGDAFSPGWFEIPLAAGDRRTIVVAAGPAAPIEAAQEIAVEPDSLPRPSSDTSDSSLESALRRAASAFIVRRGDEKTIVAGYPWFLDWGRDALIAARGLVAAGELDACISVLRTFGQLEREGTLPNALAGDSTSDRETSDAPLWFTLACEEAADVVGPQLYDIDVGDGRTIGDVLVSIGRHHIAGCPNGVRVDLESGLVWSPSHFTWMDTNHPACTPREGYPVELAALFLRFLRQLERHDLRLPDADVSALAARASASLAKFYRADLGCFADVLHAPRGSPARVARPDDHVRPNQLVAVALGLVPQERARSIVSTCSRLLVVPGAVRSLAAREVTFQLPLAAQGRALGDPFHPYRGRYEGDEDTSRKPAYHNGTAWVWLLPTFVEAMVRAWNESPEAIAAARALLTSTARLLESGAIGSLPEILDGDPPHGARGCDAQAFSVFETLRVAIQLERLGAR